MLARGAQTRKLQAFSPKRQAPRLQCAEATIREFLIWPDHSRPFQYTERSVPFREWRNVEAFAKLIWLETFARSSVAEYLPIDTETILTLLTYNNLPARMEFLRTTVSAVNQIVSRELCDMSAFTGIFINRHGRTRG